MTSPTSSHAPSPPLRLLQTETHSAGLPDLIARLDALVPAVCDGLAVDVHVRHGEVLTGVPTGLAARTLGRLLPSRLRGDVAAPVPLDAMLRAVEGRARLVIRVHGSMDDPAPDVARVLYPLADRSHLLLCAQDWLLADRLLAWLPGLRVAYLALTEGPLRRFVQGRLDGSLRETPLLVAAPLLHTADEAASLRGRAGALGAWGVESPVRARELAAWGLDLVASGWPDALRALPRSAARPAAPPGDAR